MNKKLFSHSGLRFRRPFTQEEIEFLREKAKSRIEIKTLAMELNISPITLQSRAKSLGITFQGRDGWLETDDASLLKDFRAGIVIDQLAKKYHKNSRFIRRRLKVLGENVPENIYYLPLARENAKLKKLHQFKCRYCENVFEQSERVYGKNFCKPCQTQQLQRRYAKLKSELSLHSLLRRRLAQSKNRAKQRNWSFDLTIEFLIQSFNTQKGKCFYSGLDMQITLNDRYSISIDRIDSTKGYIKTNVVLCCDAVNTMKNDMNLEELKTICAAILQK